MKRVAHGDPVVTAYGVEETAIEEGYLAVELVIVVVIIPSVLS